MKTDEILESCLRSDRSQTYDVQLKEKAPPVQDEQRLGCETLTSPLPKFPGCLRLLHT